MINGELLIDNFAGGGGASTGIELATGYSVDIAINHDPQAIWTENDFEPEGPRTLNDSPGTLYWRNETMTFAVYPVDVPEDNQELLTYLALLENIELPEDKYL